MDRDTPLPDVVTYLPTEVAKYLHDFPPSVQELTVAMLRDAIVSLEERHCVLDPTQLETVLLFVAQEAVTFARYLADEAIRHYYLSRASEGNPGA